jgi:hypothetical protein
VFVLPKPALLRFVVDWISAPHARPPPCGPLFMILMQAGVDSRFPQVLAAGFIFPKSGFTGGLTAVTRCTHRYSASDGQETDEQ